MINFKKIVLDVFQNYVTKILATLGIACVAMVIALLKEQPLILVIILMLSIVMVIYIIVLFYQYNDICGKFVYNDCVIYSLGKQNYLQLKFCNVSNKNVVYQTKQWKVSEQVKKQEWSKPDDPEYHWGEVMTFPGQNITVLSIPVEVGIDQDDDFDFKVRYECKYGPSKDHMKFNTKLELNLIRKYKYLSIVVTN